MAEKHYCGQCVYFTRFYCPKRNKQVSYGGYVCDDFEFDSFKRLSKEE